MIWLGKLGSYFSCKFYTKETRPLLSNSLDFLGDF